MAQQGQLRVIAGKWRGTKIPVEEVKALRPTPNRIRETLFNWLQLDILDAECLDMFAGSGALSFEAASRGAKHIDCIELDSCLSASLEKLIKKLQAEEQISAHRADAIQWLENASRSYDLIFLDPPFHQDLITPLLEKIYDNGLLKANGKVYVETEKDLDLQTCLQFYWQIIKNTRAGDVQAYLLALNSQ